MTHDTESPIDNFDLSDGFGGFSPTPSGGTSPVGASDPSSYATWVALLDLDFPATVAIRETWFETCLQDHGHRYDDWYLCGEGNLWPSTEILDTMAEAGYGTTASGLVTEGNQLGTQWFINFKNEYLERFCSCMTDVDWFDDQTYCGPATESGGPGLACQGGADSIDSARTETTAYCNGMCNCNGLNNDDLGYGYGDTDQVLFGDFEWIDCADVVYPDTGGYADESPYTMLDCQDDQCESTTSSAVSETGLVGGYYDWDRDTNLCIFITPDQVECEAWGFVWGGVSCSEDVVLAIAEAEAGDSSDVTPTGTFGLACESPGYTDASYAECAQDICENEEGSSGYDASTDKCICDGVEYDTTTGEVLHTYMVSSDGMYCLTVVGEGVTEGLETGDLFTEATDLEECLMAISGCDDNEGFTDYNWSDCTNPALTDYMGIVSDAVTACAEEYSSSEEELESAMCRGGIGPCWTEFEACIVSDPCSWYQCGIDYLGLAECGSDCTGASSEDPFFVGGHTYTYDYAVNYAAIGSSGDADWWLTCEPLGYDEFGNPLEGDDSHVCSDYNNAHDDGEWIMDGDAIVGWYGRCVCDDGYWDTNEYSDAGYWTTPICEAIPNLDLVAVASSLGTQYAYGWIGGAAPDEWDSPARNTIDQLNGWVGINGAYSVYAADSAEFAVGCYSGGVCLHYYNQEIVEDDAAGFDASYMAGDLWDTVGGVARVYFVEEDMTDARNAATRPPKPVYWDDVDDTDTAYTYSIYNPPIYSSAEQGWLESRWGGDATLNDLATPMDEALNSLVAAATSEVYASPTLTFKKIKNNTIFNKKLLTSMDTTDVEAAKEEAVSVSTMKTVTTTGGGGSY